MGPAEGRVRVRPLLKQRAAMQPLLLQETFEFLLEARQAATAVDQVLLTAGPGRMRLRVDVEMQRVARLAPGRPGRELGAVGHDHFDEVVVGMSVRFHGSLTALAGAGAALVCLGKSGGSIARRKGRYKQRLRFSLRARCQSGGPRALSSSRAEFRGEDGHIGTAAHESPG